MDSCRASMCFVEIGAATITSFTIVNMYLLEYKRNWIQHVNRMPRNRLPRVMKHYSPTGRRNHGSKNKCQTTGRPRQRTERSGEASLGSSRLETRCSTNVMMENHILIECVNGFIPVTSTFIV
jgi:hypothetical protein